MTKFLTLCLGSALIGATLYAQPSAHFQQLQHKPHATPSAQKVATHHDSPLLRTDFAWNDSVSQWDSAGRATWAYYPDGNEAEYIYEVYDSTGFTPWVRQILTYTAQNQEDVLTVYDWNGSNWVLSWKDESTYDQYGNNTLVMEYTWNGVSWDSAYAERYLYNYVFTDKVGSATYQEWSSNQPVWTNTYRDEYTWPTSAAWEAQTSSEWNGSGWDYVSRDINVLWHDFAQYQPAFELNQSYDGSNWVDASRRTYTYGTNDSYVELTESWSGSSWDSIYRAETTYDSYGHETLSEFFHWSGFWEMVAGYQVSYNYDGTGRTLDETYHYYDGSNYVLSEWKVYDGFFTGATEPATLQAQVTAFPNPCADELHFQIDLQQNSPVQIALYDLQGRLRMQSQAPRLIDRQVTLPISQVLENGTYLYRISTKEGVAQGKVVVQR